MGAKIVFRDRKHDNRLER